MSRPKGTGTTRTVAAALAVLALTVAGACSANAGPADIPTEAVVRIEAPACNGLTGLEATGVALTDDLVATVAHTFDRVQGFTLIDVDGRRLDGELVLLDVDRDIALIRPEAPLPRVLELGRPVDGASGVVVSAADPDALDVKAATVLRQASLTLDGVGERQGIEIEAEIRSGDSGAPLLDDDHRVIGMIFASSNPTGRGWAISSAELEAALDQVGPPVELGCGR
ncbi:MAG: serine protease [Actinomycetota bacterium]